jgi:hypothetical protein
VSGCGRSSARRGCRQRNTTSKADDENTVLETAKKNLATAYLNLSAEIKKLNTKSSKKKGKKELPKALSLDPDDLDEDEQYIPTPLQRKAQQAQEQPSKYSPTSEIVHVFGSMYGWTFETYYYKTPIYVIAELCEMIKERSSHGFLGYQELQFFKAYTRARGFKGWDE